MLETLYLFIKRKIIHPFFVNRKQTKKDYSWHCDEKPPEKPCFEDLCDLERPGREMSPDGQEMSAETDDQVINQYS